jgi:hypothetical protein
MKKKRTIRYLGVDPLASALSAETILKYYAVNTEGASVKIYLHSLLALAKLHSDQLTFLLFLFQLASSSGKFRYHKPVREDFQEFSKKACGKVFASRTISRWIKDLVDNQIIVKINKHRGNYMLSPVFFGIDQDEHYNVRERELRKLLEKPVTNLASRVRAEAMAEKELSGILKDAALLRPAT